MATAGAAAANTEPAAQVEVVDFAVVGAGVAGLAAALSIHLAFNGTDADRQRLFPKAAKTKKKNKKKNNRTVATAQKQHPGTGAGPLHPAGTAAAGTPGSAAAAAVSGATGQASCTRSDQAPLPSPPPRPPAPPLRRRVIRVAVFERDSCYEERQQGYGLTLTYNPSGPLAKLGLLDACRARDTASRSHYVFGPAGHVRGYFGNAFISGKGHMFPGQRGNLRIPRQELQQLLLQRLRAAGVDVFWGKTLHDLEVVDAGAGSQASSSSSSSSSLSAAAPSWQRVRLEFTDGSSCVARLAVGADGIRSRTRRIVEDRLQQHDAARQQRRDEHAAARSVPPPGASAGTVASSARVAARISVACVPPAPSRRSSGSVHLRFIGVGVILGLSTLEHPLLVERGFYTVDGRQRLFTMPFKVEEGDRNGDGEMREEEEGLHEEARDGAATTQRAVAVAAAAAGSGHGEAVLRHRTHMSTATYERPVSATTTVTSGAPTGCVQDSSCHPHAPATKRTKVPPSPQRSPQRRRQHHPRRLTMWQLSFPVTEAEAKQLFGRSGRRRSGGGAHVVERARAAAKELEAEALRRVRGWHAPVEALLSNSVEGSTWGTALYDVDPAAWVAARQAARRRLRTGRRSDAPVLGLLELVTHVGDAVHGMSPFKGQGANQALADGPLLAHWLHETLARKETGDGGGGDGGGGGRGRGGRGRRGRGRRGGGAAGGGGGCSDDDDAHALYTLSTSTKALPRAVACFEREMSQRSSVKVADSYASARRLHYSPDQTQKTATTTAAAAAAAGRGGGDDAAGTTVLGAAAAGKDEGRYAEFRIAGVAADALPRVLAKLRARGITAGLAKRLDAEVAEVIVQEQGSLGKY